MDTAEKIRSALYMGIVGDTLGVPAEPTPTHDSSLCSVKNLLGYGRFDQPQGTWSDDTSMVLCTMESLCRGYDLDDLGNTFCKWLFESYWTPYGHVVDCGVTTFLALESLKSGTTTASTSGQVSEDDNGNGCLMRILPAALYFRNLPFDSFLDTIHDIAGITHAHPRSKIACGVYATFVRFLLSSDHPKAELYETAMEASSTYYDQREAFRPQLQFFARVLSGQLLSMPRQMMSNSGYVVDTLESALWCFLHHDSAAEVIMAAASMGLDTDTNGMAAGGLAGIRYGVSDLCLHWSESLARRTEIQNLINTFVEAALRQ